MCQTTNLLQQGLQTDCVCRGETEGLLPRHKNTTKAQQNRHTQTKTQYNITMAWMELYTLSFSADKESDSSRLLMAAQREAPYQCSETIPTSLAV